MTTYDQTLTLLSISSLCYEVKCTCTETFNNIDHAVMQIHTVWLKLEPLKTSHIVVSGCSIFHSDAFVKLMTRFNWSLGKLVKEKFKSCYLFSNSWSGKNRPAKYFFQLPLEKGKDFSFFLPHITSNYFGDIPPLHHPIYLQSNRRETLAELSMVEVTEEVVETVVVSHKFAI